jgi:IS1 family transposase
MTNPLPPDRRRAILHCLLEGNFIRGTERLTGVHRDTVMKHLVKMGEGCARLMDRSMRSLKVSRLELDEQWGFVGKKEKNVTAEDDPSVCGDAWTFVAMDPVTKLVPCFHLGKRTEEDALLFIRDLAGRVVGRPQIATDGWAAYRGAIEAGFGPEVDYGQIVKDFEVSIPGEPETAHARIQKTPISGTPNPDLVSTSMIERQNLSVRMGVRRMTRKTFGYSKKWANHRHALSLWYAYYNFSRVHSTLRVTPSMAAGITDHVWDLDELIKRALGP